MDLDNKVRIDYGNEEQAGQREDEGGKTGTTIRA